MCFSVVTQEYRYRFPGASEFKLLCKPNLEGWRPKAAWAADKSSWQRSVPFLYSIVSSTLGNSNAEVGWSVLEFSGFTDQSFIQSILLSFSTIVTVVIREIWTLTGSPPRSPRSLYQNVSMMFHQCILCSEVFGEIWCLKWRAILFSTFWQVGKAKSVLVWPSICLTLQSYPPGSNWAIKHHHHSWFGDRYDTDWYIPERKAGTSIQQWAMDLWLESVTVYRKVGWLGTWILQTTSSSWLQLSGTNDCKSVVRMLTASVSGTCSKWSIFSSTTDVDAGLRVQEVSPHRKHQTSHCDNLLETWHRGWGGPTRNSLAEFATFWIEVQDPLRNSRRMIMHEQLWLKFGIK